MRNSHVRQACWPVGMGLRPAKFYEKFSGAANPGCSRLSGGFSEARKPRRGRCYFDAVVPSLSPAKARENPMPVVGHALACPAGGWPGFFVSMGPARRDRKTATDDEICALRRSRLKGGCSQDWL